MNAHLSLLQQSISDVRRSTKSRQSATLDAIKHIAYATARDAKGQRKQDAIKHCEKLGIVPPK